MKILLLADREEPGLWDYYQPSKTKDIDLILAAGDLSADYLEFLVTMANKPLFYVRGNHDDGYAVKEPLGCDCIENQIVTYKNIRIMGLGGSMKYRDGKNMYTEREMEKRIRKMKRQLKKNNGFDILLSHVPPLGYGDLEDLPHLGFDCFNDLLNTYHPAYHVHGHIHQEYGNFERYVTHPSGTVIVNACGSCVIEIEPK